MIWSRGGQARPGGKGSDEDEKGEGSGGGEGGGRRRAREREKRAPGRCVSKPRREPPTEEIAPLDSSAGSIPMESWHAPRARANW